MKSQKNELATLSSQQSNPYTAKPEDFEVGRADEFAGGYVPGHGQCGSDEKEYDRLLKQTDKHGKSKFGAPRLPATEASDAAKPSTDGIDQAEG
jgi:hypothetical protein